MMPQTVSMRLLALATGAALGGVLPELAAGQSQRRGYHARWALLLAVAMESAGTLLACLLCALAWPQTLQQAMLYAGLGAVLGVAMLDHKQAEAAGIARGLAASCVWLSLTLPFTGTMCCVAGITLALYFGYAALALPVLAVAAVPIALVQFGAEYAAVIAMAAALSVGRLLRGIPRGLPR